MKKTRNLILRIIASPFVLGLVLIKFNYHALNLTRLFLIHGGEFVPYAKDDANHTIGEIFNELKLQTNNPTK